MEQSSQPPLCVKGCGFFGYVFVDVLFLLLPARVSEGCDAFFPMVLSNAGFVLLVGNLTRTGRNEASLNMCSKCYKNHSAKEGNKATSVSPLPTVVPAPTAAAVSAASALVSLASPSSPGVMDRGAMTVASPSSPAPTVIDGRPVQENTKKCWSCKKKVGLTGFKCRCGYVYCGTHRYSDMHPCDFDYKALGKDELAKSNPVVMGSKVEKI